MNRSLLLCSLCTFAFLAGPRAFAQDNNSLSATSAPAGVVTFNVTNSGTMVHEFVILKTDILAKDLPVVDGAVVEDDYSPVGEVPETDPGKSGTFSATLAAGHYAIICNIADHVAAGMVIDFTVN